MLISILVQVVTIGRIDVLSPRLCHDLRHVKTGIWTEPRVFGYLKRTNEEWSSTRETPSTEGGKDALNLDFTPRFAEQLPDAFEEIDESSKSNDEMESLSL
jgi:hypothetical protein